MPFTIPTLYVGSIGSGGISFHSGNVESLSGEFLCTRFPSVTGINVFGGVTCEYWVNASTALSFDVGYQIQNATFSQLSNQIPMANGKFLQTRYELSTKRPTLKVRGGAKSLLFESHVWVGAAFELEYQLNSTTSLQEFMVSPDGMPFETNPPSFVITYPGSAIQNVRSLIVVPSVCIGYDMELGKGMYASPSLRYALPFQSQATSIQWNVSTLWAEIKILYGINPHVMD